MSKSLSITVTGTNGTDIGTVYYRWSGTTPEALSRASELIDYFESSTESDELLNLVNFVLNNNGSLSEQETDNMKLRYPNLKFDKPISGCLSAGYPILGTTFENSKLLSMMSGYGIELNLKTKQVNDITAYAYNSLEDLLSETEDVGYSFEDENNIKDIEYDLQELPFDYTHCLAEELSKSNSEILRYKDKEGTEKYFWATTM